MCTRVRTAHTLFLIFFKLEIYVYFLQHQFRNVTHIFAHCAHLFILNISYIYYIVYIVRTCAYCAHIITAFKKYLLF